MGNTDSKSKSSLRFCKLGSKLTFVTPGRSEAEQPLIDGLFLCKLSHSSGFTYSKSNLQVNPVHATKFTCLTALIIAI